MEVKLFLCDRGAWYQTFSRRTLCVPVMVQVMATPACTTFTNESTKNTRSTRGNTTASLSPQSLSRSWYLGLLHSCGSRSNWGDRLWVPKGEKGAQKGGES